MEELIKNYIEMEEQLKDRINQLERVKTATIVWDKIYINVNVFQTGRDTDLVQLLEVPLKTSKDEIKNHTKLKEFRQRVWVS